jgi:hypothetical protein
MFDDLDNTITTFFDKVDEMFAPMHKLHKCKWCGYGRHALLLMKDGEYYHNHCYSAKLRSVIK